MIMFFTLLPSNEVIIKYPKNGRNVKEVREGEKKKIRLLRYRQDLY